MLISLTSLPDGARGSNESVEEERRIKKKVMARFADIPLTLPDGAERNNEE